MHVYLFAIPLLFPGAYSLGGDFNQLLPILDEVPQIRQQAEEWGRQVAEVIPAQKEQLQRLREELEAQQREREHLVAENSRVCSAVQSPHVR